MRIHTSTPDERGAYAALSYCWGGERNLVLTSESLQHFENGIALVYVPKTIRHAIHFTRELGIRYLWVDALCIMQDSQTDKRNEILNMRNIYKGALVTVVAAEAHTVFDGFFEPPKSFTAATDTDEDLSFKSEDTSAVKEPIFTRAWTLEERLLSCRSIVFSSHGPFWECRQGKWRMDDGLDCSVDTDIEIGDRMHSGRSDGQRGGYGLYTDDVAVMWEDIVSDYTQRTLTKKGDKLNAIAGIAEEFGRAWGAGLGAYMCGIWSSHIVRGLMWRVQLIGEDRHPSMPFSGGVNSWSWTSNDFEVTFSAPRYQLERVPPFQVKVLKVQKDEKENQHEYLDAPATKIQLEGPLTEVVYHQSFNLEDGVRDAITVPSLREASQVRQGVAYNDYRQRPRDDLLWALVFETRNVPYSNQVDCSGLLLRCTPETIKEPLTSREFKRIGWFEQWRVRNFKDWITDNHITLV
ncbi:MAG: hypothetical protein Q9162_004323 [Coniocarpon cinnabarinum]